MDTREAKFTIGFILLGLAPLLATAAGAGWGVAIFSVGMLISASTAFV